MWFLQFATRLLGRTPKHTIGFIRSMTLPIMVIIMVLGLINGLAGEIETTSGSVGPSTRLILLADGETDLSKSTLDESVIETLTHPKIRQILPQKLGQASIHFGNTTCIAEVLGVNQTAFLQFFEEAIIEIGSPPSKNNESTALIGAQLAKRLPDLKDSFPTNVLFSRENSTEQFNISLVSIIGGMGRYLNNLILPSSMFTTLFPESSGKISFLELKLGDTSEIEETIETLQRQARDGGYHVQIFSEQAQKQITVSIMKDIILIFWAFGAFAFFIVGIQTYFAIKWISLHYRAEFATLRCLGTSKRIVNSILLFSAILLGNIALLLATLIGILSVTALLAIITIFTHTTRFYASIDLASLLIVALLTNLAVILGSLGQIRESGRRSLFSE